MLSATAEKDIHTKLFSGCNFVELPQARYQGKLILDHEKSYSRYYFEQAPERLFKELTDRHLDCNFITFKKFTQYLDIDKSRILYFGRSIGVNCFTGKNLVVVGVPHKPEYVYRLTAHALDIECENDTLAIRVTEANGFSFYMMTFKNKEMQKLQQYFLETDLEQAIGRVRLLNKNCTVYVYSRYPAKQCVLAEEILDDTGNTVGN